MSRQQRRAVLPTHGAVKVFSCVLVTVYIFTYLNCTDHYKKVDLNVKSQIRRTLVYSKQRHRLTTHASTLVILPAA